MGQTGLRYDVDVISVRGDLLSMDKSQVITIPILAAPYGLQSKDETDHFAANALAHWQRIVSLSTAPLWTLLVSLLHLFPWDILTAVKGVGSLLLCANALVTRQLAQQLRLARSGALLAGLVVVLTPRFLWASQSSMEILLYALLATGGLLLHRRSFSTKQSLWGTWL